MSKSQRKYWVVTEGSIDVWIETGDEDPSCEAVNAIGPFSTLKEAKANALERLRTDAATVAMNRSRIRSTRLDDFV